MKKHLFYLSMALITALFSACGNGKKVCFTRHPVVGRNEILVVIDQRDCGSVLPVVLSMMYLILTYLGFPVGTFIPYYVYFSGKP